MTGLRACARPCQRGGHVPQRLRHLQDRRRPVELAHHGPDARRRPLPRRAARRRATACPAPAPPPGSRRRLHGSLAFTGKGHATDRAVILGCSACSASSPTPSTPTRPSAAWPTCARPAASTSPASARSPSTRRRAWSSTTARRSPATPTAWCCAPSTPPATCTSTETYYSIGGGFVLTERELKGATLKGDDAAGQPPLSLRHRRRDARHGRGLRPLDRRDEARQRDRRRPRHRSTPASTASGR